MSDRFQTNPLRPISILRAGDELLFTLVGGVISPPIASASALGAVGVPVLLAPPDEEEMMALGIIGSR